MKPDSAYSIPSVTVIAAGLLAFAGCLAATPNIILITVDGMGYGDISAYGGTAITTPAIDRMAAAGVRATVAYAPAPFAAASRYGLLTGARPQRFGIQADADANAESPGDRVPASHPLLPQLLRTHGYTSAMVGKWNFRTDPRIYFDAVYSPIDWDADYFPDREGHYPGVWRKTKFDKAGIDYGWGPLRPSDEYLTDRLGRHARDFIEQSTGQPFFLYLAFNAPGRPLQAKAEHRPAVAHLPTEAQQLYAAMVLAVDDNIGRILDLLDALEIADNTLIVFTSDHGPAYGFDPGWPDHWQRQMQGSTGGLRGHQGSFEEGGLRVPLILCWPAGAPQGSIYQHPVSLLDLHPTLTAAAGAAIPAHIQLDGRNLWPFLTAPEANALPHAEFFWMQEQGGALRVDSWKLIVDDTATSAVRLYDLDTDPEEGTNLASSESLITQQMLTRWRQLAAAMPPSFRELEQYFRQIDIDRRNNPQVLHVAADEYRLAEFIADMASGLPALEFLGDDLYYAPSIGFFYTNPQRFPLLAHAQWGDVYFHHYPDAPLPYPLFYAFARSFASSQPLGWLIPLSAAAQLFYAPSLESIIHIPVTDFWQLWVYAYAQDQWSAYDSGQLPPEDNEPEPAERSRESYEALLAQPPDGGGGPALWFKYAREPNFGDAGAAWSIRAAAALDVAQSDFYGDPEAAFALAPGSTGGAAISGSGGTQFATGSHGTLILSFQTGDDVQTLASIFSKGTYSDSDPFEITLTQASLRLNFRRDASAKASVTLISLTPATWYTLAVSWDLHASGNHLHWICRNMASGELHSGALAATAVGTAAQPIRVAGRNNLNPFFGALQNIAIYERSIHPMDLATILDRIP